MGFWGDFYKIWIGDLICDLLPKRNIYNKFKLRNPIEDHRIYVEIHEWGGYDIKREKLIRKIRPFECGLAYQIERFRPYRRNRKIHLTITLSDPERCKNLDYIKSNCDCFVEVDNKGMDFSGYNVFFNKVSQLPNSYVILTNSSVNSYQSDFLDSYIDYMEKNQDVGMLGVSCCSQYYHTLLRNNYNPHIQSFFILTTINVLKELVDLNGGVFPGVGITNKHLLIRNGEVLLSKLVLRLGYKLAVVTENSVAKISYENYPFPKGDYRCTTMYPNAIFPIR